MPRITARDTASGKTVTFDWSGEGQPTDADMAEVFKAAQGEPYKPIRPPTLGLQPIGSHGANEPEDPNQGTTLLSRLEPMARPSGMGDFASLLVPATALGAGMGALRGWGAAAKNLFQGAEEGAANREGLKKLPAALQGMKNVATDVVSGRDRAFQALPLEQQIGDLPTKGAMPMGGRVSGPPLSEVNPNDVPLWKQMESLPTKGAMPMGGRVGMPRMQASDPMAQLMADIESARTAGGAPLPAEVKAKLLELMKQRSGR